MFKKVNSKQNFPEMEKDILKSWKENKIFEKSVDNRDDKKTYSFYDGPPFATGLPHYGHIVASLIKDVVPRFWTMKGYQVKRRWGWDCHGLPVENLIEKELGIKNKQEIEELGIDKFNQACRASVLRYADDWKKFIPRIGRWVDMDHDYKTMNASYTESIWWVFSELYKKGLIYESYKSMHICPRCETTLSNFEVTQGYKDITDLSATVKFKLKAGQKIGNLKVDDNTFVLAWTTTPWTLPGNVALAVGEDIEYVMVKFENDFYVLAKDIFQKWKEESRGNWIIWDQEGEEIADENDFNLMRFCHDSEITNKIKSKDLIGLKYEPLFGYLKKLLEDQFNTRVLKKNESEESVDAFSPNTEDIKAIMSYENNVYKIYSDNKDNKFITTEDGTGIVHIAPAFGDDDYKLSKENNLPMIQHVNMDGRLVEDITYSSWEENMTDEFIRSHDGFVEKIKDKKESERLGKWIGQEVKPKRNPRETDEKIVEFLKDNNKLFSKENYKHSYPHCWRCDTPLLNYATSSWFVKVTEIKKQMIKNNQEINWMPKYIKDGRFGKWLEEARDWAISRNRYWGAPIPIWKCGGVNKAGVNIKAKEINKNESRITNHESGGCGNLIVVDSRKKLGELAIGENVLVVARHGETDWNKEGRMLGRTDMGLNKTGQQQAEGLIGLLEKEKIDIVISSPLKRAYQTAEIVIQNKIKILEDDLLKERSMGDFEGMTKQEIKNKYPDTPYYLVNKDGEEHRYWKDIPKGESFIAVKKRVDEFVEKINNKYRGKRILVFSHAGFLDMLYVRFNNGDYQKGLGHHGKNCSVEKHNLVEATDLHRPAIDKIILKCPECGGEAHRVPEVLDCWFESGSMPYAQWHYPFENQEEFEKSFPANFIAEGLDQTRGWFYTLIVLSAALFKKPAFKNVIVNGIVLAEDGQKMSKRLKNYPDPNLIVEKYSADALRYYLLSSPVMKAENLNFSERGVEEVLKKFILTMWNTYSFLVMNAGLVSSGGQKYSPPCEGGARGGQSENLLDKWILSEFNILIEEVNKQMKNYDLARASRPLRDFIDKLSNWYVRRSRKRFSSDDIKDRDFAFQTLHYVLVEYSKLMAPFMPFISEEIYKNLTGKESVHLEDYPVADKNLIDEKVSNEMNFVRQVVTLGLAIRAKNSLKVRQPLSELRIANCELRVKDELLNLIKDELNVKDVEFVDKIKEEDGWILEENGNLKIALNSNITDELKLEGQAREIVRHIQMMRKEAKYNRDDLISIKYSFVGENEDIKKVFDKWGDYIKKECLTEGVEFTDELVESDFDLVKELKIGKWVVEIGIRNV